MLKKNFRILCIFTIIAVLFSFASCKKKNEQKPEDNGGGGNQGTTVTDVLTVVRADGVSDEALYAVVDELAAIIGSEVRAFDYKAGTSYGENVVYLGAVPEKTSESAYRMLSRIDTNDKNDLRYLIYGSGKTLAIAYEADKYGVDGARKTAVEALSSVCSANGGCLAFGDGVLSSGVINTIEYQRAEDQAELDRQFEDLYEQIVKKLGGDRALADDIYKSIKDIYGLYTDDMISWMANLYDPDSGGFYYSNSARDTVGFLPDIESTAQMLDIITSSGLSTIDDLPDWLKDGMVRFVKGLQDENGYFYHPQWGKELTDANPSRRSRDVSKAVSLLQRLGSKPTYDTPSGVKGDGILADGTPISKVHLSSHLRKSVASAVSAVIGAASFDYNSSYLESVEAFKAWLGTLDLNSSSYQNYFMGDRLSTVSGEIVARDKELKKQGKGGLCEALMNWLYEKQNKLTGLWTAGDIDLDGVNGLFKILSVHDAMGAELRYPIEALNSTMTILETMKAEEIIRVCDIFNIWNIFIGVKKNIENYSGDSFVKAEVTRFCSEILVNSSAGLKNTAKYLALFLKLDGSMSYAPNTSASTSHGMNVAVPNTNEGDVNGTALGSVGTICDLMPILGLTYVPIFTRGDGIAFISMLEDMGSIIKREQEASEPVNFDDYDIGEGCDIVSSSSIASSGGGISIVESPDKKGKSLLIKSTNDGYDYVLIPSDSGILGASCFVIEGNFRISNADFGAVAQINIYDAVYMLSLNVNDVDQNGVVDANDTISIYETSSNNKSNWVMTEFGTIAHVDEWFNLRIEYYPGTHDTVRIKIFVNDKLLAVTDTYWGKVAEADTGSPRSHYTSLRIVMPSTKASHLYVDDLLVTKTLDEYAPEDIPEGDPAFGGIVVNVDSPDRVGVKYEFEGNEDYIASESGTTLADGKITLTSGAKLTFPINMRLAKANCTVFEAELLVADDTAAGAIYEILMRNSFGNAIVRLQMKVVAEGQGKSIALAEASGGKIGNFISGFTAPLGETFKLGLHYYKDEGIILVYLNGDLVGSTDYLCTGAKGYRPLTLDFSDLSASGTKSSITVDNLTAERRYSSYELATSPDSAEIIYGFENGMPSDLVASGGVTVKDGVLTLSFANSAGSVLIPLNRRTESGDSVVFSARLGAPKDSNNGGFKIELLNKSGKTILAYEITTNGSTYSIYEVTASRRYDSPIATFDAGGHELTIEFYPDREIAEIFIDEKCVAKSSLTYEISPTDTAATHAKISVIRTSNATFDDLRAEIYDKLYLPSSGSFANPESAGEKYTFESSTTGSLPSPIYTDFRSSRASLKIKERTMGDNVGKVLEFATSSGENDSLYVPVTKKVAGANGVAFEADMKLDLLSSSDGMEIYLQVGSSHATKITLKYSGGKIAIYDNAGTINFNFTVENATWFNLRLEYSVTANDYTGDGNADALVRIYINDILHGTGYNTYNMSYTAQTVTRARLYTFSASEFVTYLDNVTVEQFMMDTAPHEHEFDSAFSYDEDGHWFSAICSDNGSCATATTEKLPHVFGSDNVCECGYKMPAPHEHEYSEEYSYDKENHWHKSLCRIEEECENAVTVAVPHTFDDEGKCICGYKKIIYSEGGSDTIISNPDGWTDPEKNSP